MPDVNPARTIKDIPGWFAWTDQQLFRYFLGLAAPQEPGHLVELGVYLGKSAALIGEYQRPGERFVVCDLFNGDSDLANTIENSRSYAQLTREAFEENYRAVRGDLPEIVQGLSSTITDHVDAGTVRFLHVDASHLYRHVVGDIASAVTLLSPNGVVVFDDVRAKHTPGVAAAVWAAVGDGRLHPVCVTPCKLYAVVGDPGPVREGLQAWLMLFGRLMWESQDIGDHPVLRIWPSPPTPRPAKPSNAELEALLRRVDRRLADVEKQVALTNTRLQQNLVRRVGRSVLRRLRVRRDQGRS